MIGPHENQPVLNRGLPLAQANSAMILVHGRGASAESILTLADEFETEDMAFLAPQAAHNTWYPYSFLAPISQNEPGISSGIMVLAGLVAQVTAVGIPAEKIILVGFSQGACLALEFAARHPRQYGGVAGLSGGLIGPEGTSRAYSGSLAGTPVFLGCSDVDFHIPKERVWHSAEVLKKMGAAVTTRLYPGMGHLVNEDELAFVQNMVKNVSGAG